MTLRTYGGKSLFSTRPSKNISGISVDVYPDAATYLRASYGVDPAGQMSVIWIELLNMSSGIQIGLSVVENFGSNVCANYLSPDLAVIVATSQMIILDVNGNRAVTIGNELGNVIILDTRIDGDFLWVLYWQSFEELGLAKYSLEQIREVVNDQ